MNNIFIYSYIVGYFTNGPYFTRTRIVLRRILLFFLLHLFSMVCTRKITVQKEILGSRVIADAQINWRQAVDIPHSGPTPERMSSRLPCRVKRTSESLDAACSTSAAEKRTGNLTGR